MVAHAVRLDRSGHLQVARVAPPEDPDALRRTAAALRAAAGAGAVEVVELTDDGDRVELVLAYAGRPVSAPLPATDAARLGAALGRVLAAIHDRGLTHGALRPEHVLVDAEGTVRLCGFTGGTAVDDVRDFGALVLSLLDEREHGAVVESVRATATRCIVDDPDARPTMAAVASGLAALAASPRPDDAGVRTGRGGTRAVAVAVAATVLTLVTAWLVVDRRPPAADVVAVTPGPTHRTTSTSTPAPTRVWPRTPPEVVGAGASWRVGDVGDHVLVGDWDCDAVETPVVIRPGGDVFVVDAFPTGDTVVARYVTTVPDPVAAAVTRRGCDELDVTTADGRAVSVSLRRGRAA